MHKALPRFILAAVFTFLLLFPCACSSTIDEESVQSASENDLTLTASFQRPDGSALRGMQADFCSGQMQDTSSLDEQGSAVFPNAPRDGEAVLTLRDSSGEVSRISLLFATASVTDASTDADGVGHISVKVDAVQLHLLLTLDDDEQLQCSLYLNDLQT
jgi:hypothetical protein